MGFTLQDGKLPTRGPNAKRVKNIVARDSIAKVPKLPIPRCARELGLRRMITYRILLKDLSLHPHKIV